MSALKRNRGLWQACGLVLTSVLLGACGSDRVPAPRMEVVNATLTTSDGQHEFRTQSFFTDPDRDTYNLALYAEPPGLQVWIAPFGLTSKIQVWTESEGAKVEFVIDNVFYEADYRDQQILGAYVDEAFDQEGRPMPTLIYFVPDELQGILYTMSGRIVFPDEAADYIRSTRDVVHRFYFEFAVDGKPYVADVAFRLDVVMDTTEGVPY